VKFIKPRRDAPLRGTTVNDETTGALITYDNTTDQFTVDGAPLAPGATRPTRAAACAPPGAQAPGAAAAAAPPRRHRPGGPPAPEHHAAAEEKPVMGTRNAQPPGSGAPWRSRLEARHLQKSYGGRKVVKDVSLTSTRARSSACSGPTAPARPPRST
jgi:hypothetical protein